LERAGHGVGALFKDEAGAKGREIFKAARQIDTLQGLETQECEVVRFARRTIQEHDSAQLAQGQQQLTPVNDSLQGKDLGTEGEGSTAGHGWEE
jgi:hypothetical protein